MWLPLVGLAVGLAIGFLTIFQVPVEFARYTAVATLAALDSFFGGVRGGLEGKFDQNIFIAGVLSNTILAALITYIGDLLGVDLYLAAVIVFGVRIFKNAGDIRRHLFARMAHQESARSD